MEISFAEAARIIGKVSVDDVTGCWLFRGAHTTAGYAEVFVGRRVRYLHRVMFECLYGSIPTGREIDHLCRNRGCCNPFHLEAVTHRENMLRGDTTAARHAAKTACPRGHTYDRISSAGRRWCSICNRAHSRTRRERLAANGR